MTSDNDRVLYSLQDWDNQLQIPGHLRFHNRLVSLCVNDRNRKTSRDVVLSDFAIQLIIHRLFGSGTLPSPMVELELVTRQ